MVLDGLRSKLLLVVICFVYSLAEDGGNTEDTVKMPPSIIRGPDFGHGTHLPFESKPSEVINLPCVASGTPEPKITWEKGGEKITTSQKNVELRNDGSLILKRLTFNDADIYQCFAQNSYGKSLSKSVQLEYSTIDIDKSDNPQPSNAKEGEKLIVKCRNAVVTPKNQAEYEWYFAQKASDTGFKLNPDDRISLDFNGNLLFAYTKKSDAKNGYIYKCSVRNKELDSTIAGSYSTIIIEDGPNEDFKPDIMFPSGGKVTQVALLSDKTVDLKCIFAGKPEPYVKWEKIGGNLPAGRHNFDKDVRVHRTLTIEQLQLSDEGEYKCTGYTSKWTGGHATVTLLVEAIPTFMEDGKPQNKNATEGDDVTFTCKIQGIPAPKVEWMKNGDPITDKKKYIMSADGKSITVRNVQKATDLMVVQCMGKNKHGYELGDAYLNILLKTVLTLKPVDVTVPANVTEVMFNAEAKSDASTPVTINWMFGDKPVVYREGVLEKLSNDSLWINFTGMKDEDKGNYIGTYKAIAGNGYSEDAATAELMITDVPTPAPSAVIATADTFALWWVILLVALLLLLLLLLLCCCMWCQRNRGDAYPVDEKERANGNDPEKELADDGYKDYVRPEEEPVKGSRASLSASIKLDSDDEGSLNEYGDIDTGKFNEDGSFIGLYVADNKKKESAPPPYRQNDTTV